MLGIPSSTLRITMGLDRSSRRKMLDALMALNQRRQMETGDPEIATRIRQYRKWPMRLQQYSRFNRSER